MKKTLIALTAMLMLCGCYRKGEQITPNKTNDNFDVEFLFEVDGVRVYRFEDGGKAVYFTNTNGRCQYTYYYSGGKGRVNVETLCNSNAVVND